MWAHICCWTKTWRTTATPDQSPAPTVFKVFLFFFLVGQCDTKRIIKSVGRDSEWHCCWCSKQLPFNLIAAVVRWNVKHQFWSAAVTKQCKFHEFKWWKYETLWCQVPAVKSSGETVSIRFDCAWIRSSFEVKASLCNTWTFWQQSESSPASTPALSAHLTSLSSLLKM